MTRALLLFSLLLGGLLLNGPAGAADLKTLTMKSGPGTILRMSPRTGVLPFARSERAQSVWAGGACLTDCGSYCAWGQTQCLQRDSQGQCLKLTDKCDRYCQRECRTSGGPLLAFELPWD
jgi:hypothetical protein